MLGKFTYFRTAWDRYTYPKDQTLSNPVVSSNSQLSLCAQTPPTTFWHWENCNRLRQQPNPKPTFLASIVSGIYNKPSIFEWQTTITHPIHWGIPKSHREAHKKVALCEKGLGLGLKMYSQLSIWTLGSGMNSGNQWKAQNRAWKVKEQEWGWLCDSLQKGFPMICLCK